MSDHSARAPRVLTVGAYERDNFGDLLFLLVSESYLPEAQIVAAAPFPADMTALLDRQVESVGEQLGEHDFDAVWTVGGQLGGTGLESAYRMSMPPEVWREYQAQPYRRRRELLAESVGQAPLISPYIPTPGAFERNAGVFSILNSVGLAGVRGRPPHLREELLAVLRSSDVVSVRDRESSAYLTRHHIEHTLVPDVVHAISLTHPFERDEDSDVVVVQASSQILQMLGHRAVAERLASAENLAGLRIRFLLAGAAAGHDSIEAFEKVAAHLKVLDPHRDVEIITDRRPLDLVDHLRRARVVIGTSLHVRIICAAYGVPRVTLERTKPTRYATHWDPEMPYGVLLADLDAAVGAALAAGRRPEVREASDELSRLADANVREIAARVRAQAGQRDSEERLEVAAERRATYERISRRRHQCEKATEPLHVELEETRRDLHAAQRRIAELEARLGEGASPASLRGALRRLGGRPAGAGR